MAWGKKTPPKSLSFCHQAAEALTNSVFKDSNGFTSFKINVHKLRFLI